MPQIDWVQWHNEALDGLVASIESASIDWGENAETGEAFVILGDTTTSAIEYPAALIPTYRTEIREDQSDPSEELYELTAMVWVLDEGDTKAAEATLRNATENAAAVANSLYSNRSLDRAVRWLYISRMEPGAAVLDGSTIETAELEVRMIKDAIIT